MMSNELFDKTTHEGEISYFKKYEIGKELGLLDTAEIDRVVNILVGDGFIANNEVTDSKIRITEEGKNRLENNQI